MLATVEQCEDAVRALVAEIAAVDPELRRRHTFVRTVSCELTDLDEGFSGRLDASGDVAVVPGIDPNADIRLRCSSDDFVDLLRRQLNVTSAWSSGRLTIEGSVLDLLWLRVLL